MPNKNNNFVLLNDKVPLVTCLEQAWLQLLHFCPDTRWLGPNHGYQTSCFWTWVSELCTRIHRSNRDSSVGGIRNCSCLSQTPCWVWWHPFHHDFLHRPNDAVSGILPQTLENSALEFLHQNGAQNMFFWVRHIQSNLKKILYQIIILDYLIEVKKSMHKFKFTK